MALKVGELYGEMTLRDQAFNQGIDRAGQRLTSLGSSVRKTADVAASMFTAVVGGVSALGTAAVRVGLDYNRLQQNSRAALTTLLGSAEAANEQMAKLDEFARTSPFAKQVFITAQQQLLAFGMSAERVIPTLDAIQQAVAAAGGSSQQLSEVTFVLAQIQAAGKITAQDLMQLGQRGIDAAGLIGRALGKTGPEIRASITEGTLGAEEAIAALTQGMQERFGGATAAVKEQFTGAADRIKGAFRDIGSAIATPLIDPQGGGYLVIWGNLVADGLRNAEQKARPLVDLLVQRYQPALEAIGPLLDRTGRLINQWDLSQVNRQLDELSRYTPLIAGVSTALLTLGGNSLILSRLGLSLNPVVAGIGALVLASPELREVAIELLRGLAPLVPVAGELARVLAGEAVDAIRELTPEMLELVRAVTPVAVALGTTFGGAAISAIEAVGPLVDALGTLLGWVADIPGPVLAMAAAWGLLHGPMSNVVSMITGPMTGAFSNLRTTLQASQGVAQAMGQQVGFLNTAAITARAGVTSLGTALKAAFITNPVGLAITAIATAVGAFTMAQSNARSMTQALTETLDEQTGALTELTDAWIAEELAKEQSFGILGIGNMRTMIEVSRELGVSIEDITAAYRGNVEAAERAKQAAIAYEEANPWSPAAEAKAQRYIKNIEDQIVRLKNARETTLQRAEAEGVLADAQDGTSGAIERTNALLQENINLQNEAARTNISLREAQIRETEAREAANDAITEGITVTRDHTGALDLNAASTIAADRALINLAQASLTTAEKMRENNASAAELSDTIAAQRQQFIETAMQMGYTANEARALANAYGLIPTSVVTIIQAEAAEAQKTINRFIEINNGRRILIQVDARGNTRYSQGLGVQWYEADGGIWENGRKRFADGGFNSAGVRVPRVPQIVRGGANIVWGEPETGWEAYISGKPSMRMRNIGVLAEAADRLGYMVLPKVARGYADGRITPAPTPSSTPSLTGLAIEGTLDLGDGLVGVVRGVVRETVSDARRQVRQRDGLGVH